MVEKIKLNQESNSKISPIASSSSNLGINNKSSLKGTTIESKTIIGTSPVIKVDYAGLLAKVVRKLAKRGKHAKGEETLFKALKKVDLNLKKNKASQGLSALKVQKINSEGSNAIKSSKVVLSHQGLKQNNERSPQSSNVKTDRGVKVLSPLLGKVDPKKGKTINSPLKQGSNSHKNTKSSATNDTLLALLAKIIQKAKPLVRLKKVRVAGITHQKPIPLTRKQAETEAIKRILVNATTRSEKSASVRLAKEFEEIYNLSLSNKTLTEVRELHKAADANKANLNLK